MFGGVGEIVRNVGIVGMELLEDWFWFLFVMLRSWGFYEIL